MLELIHSLNPIASFRGFRIENMLRRHRKTTLLQSPYQSAHKALNTKILENHFLKTKF